MKTKNTNMKTTLTEYGRRALSVLLSVAMTFSSTPMAYAAEALGDEDIRLHVTDDGYITDAGDQSYGEHADQDGSGDDQQYGDQVGQGYDADDGQQSGDYTATDGLQLDDSYAVPDFGRQVEDDTFDTAEPETVRGSEVQVGLVFDHAYIHYKNQVIGSPTSTLTVAAGDDVRFSAIADYGYELDEVVMDLDGVETTLAPDANDMYTIYADDVRDGLVIHVRAKGDPFMDETGGVAQPIDERGALTFLRIDPY